MDAFPALRHEEQYTICQRNNISTSVMNRFVCAKFLSAPQQRVNLLNQREPSLREAFAAAVGFYRRSSDTELRELQEIVPVQKELPTLPFLALSCKLCACAEWAAHSSVVSRTSCSSMTLHYTQYVFGDTDNFEIILMTKVFRYMA